MVAVIIALDDLANRPARVSLEASGSHKSTATHGSSTSIFRLVRSASFSPFSGARSPMRGFRSKPAPVPGLGVDRSGSGGALLVVFMSAVS